MSEKLKLSTGKILDANDGVVGLGVAPEFTIGLGADDKLYGFEESYFEGYPEPDNDWYLTRKERLELCDIMIARWQAFKAKTEAL